MHRIRSPDAGTNSNTVWYVVTAPHDGRFTIDTFGSAYDTVLSVYAGTCDALRPLVCNDDSAGVQSQVSFAVTAGATYLVEVGQFGNPPPGFGGGLLHLSLAAEVCGDGVVGSDEECDDGNTVDGDACDHHCRANDLCGTATDVPSPFFYTDARDTTVATADPADPVQCTGTANARTVWYRVVAPADGTLHVQTFGSTYDTVLSIDTGTCDALQEVGCNDDSASLQSEVFSPVTGGVTYYVEVAQFGPEFQGFGGGTLQLTMDFTPAFRGGRSPSSHGPGPAPQNRNIAASGRGPFGRRRPCRSRRG